MYTEEINLSKIIGNCPVVNVQMNGIPISCLVDSGSQVTTITETCYKQYFEKKTELENCNAYIKLVGANGLSIPISGVMIMKISLQNQVHENVHVLVVKDPQGSPMQEKKTQVPGVLGWNVLELLHTAFQTSPMLKNNTVLKKAVHTYKEQIAFSQEMEQINQSNDFFSYVKVKSKFFLPRNSSCCITGTVRQVPNRTAVLIEATEATNMPGLVVIPT